MTRGSWDCRCIEVDVEPLLNKMGVEYDPAAKYLLPNGKYIGRPEPAMVNLGAD